MNIDVFLLFKEQNKWQGNEVQGPGLEKLSAIVLHSLSSSQTCSLRRELVCVFRGGTGQGARQSQALAKSGSTRFNPRAEWQGHFLLSHLPLQDRAQLRPQSPGQSFSLCHQAKHRGTGHFNTRGAQKWAWCCWQPKEVPSLPRWTKPGEVGSRGKNPTAHPAEGSGYQKDPHATFQCTSNISSLQGEAQELLWGQTGTETSHCHCLKTLTVSKQSLLQTLHGMITYRHLTCCSVTSPFQIQPFWQV